MNQKLLDQANHNRLRKEQADRWKAQLEHRVENGIDLTIRINGTDLVIPINTEDAERFNSEILRLGERFIDDLIGKINQEIHQLDSQFKRM